jgi:hypothetical protein
VASSSCPSRAAAAAGVALSGGIILAVHGLYWLDAVVVGYHAVKPVREVLSDLHRKAAQRTATGIPGR